MRRPEYLSARRGSFYKDSVITPDQINGGFELIAGILISLNVVKIYRDKKTRGVAVAPLAFMVLWGLWNCYFYPSLGIMWSFWCGLVCTSINGIWISQMIYYNFREKRNEQRA